MLIIIILNGSFFPVNVDFIKNYPYDEQQKLILNDSGQQIDDLRS